MGDFCLLVELHREGSAPAACEAGLFQNKGLLSIIVMVVNFAVVVVHWLLVVVVVVMVGVIALVVDFRKVMKTSPQSFFKRGTRGHTSPQDVP